MAVVLDAPVLAGVAMEAPALERMIGATMEQGRCYITVATAEEFACIVTEDCGSKLAEKWIGWLYSLDDIEIIEAKHPQFMSGEFLALVAEAYTRGRLQVPAATAAALAHQLRIPVLTNRPNFAELESEGFCEVRWPL